MIYLWIILVRNERIALRALSSSIAAPLWAPYERAVWCPRLRRLLAKWLRRFLGSPQIIRKIQCRRRLIHILLLGLLRISIVGEATFLIKIVVLISYGIDAAAIVRVIVLLLISALLWVSALLLVNT